MNIVDVMSPIVASVFEILVEEGDTVDIGQELVILESMKMEVPITAESAGTIQGLLVAPSASVSEGDVLLRIRVD